MWSGWRIFRHSVVQVFGNFAVALQISLPVIIMSVMMSVFVPTFVPDEMGLGAYGGYGGYRIGIHSGALWFLMMLINVLAYVWVAVAWHRFVLMSERPGALFPRFRLGNVLKYLGRLFGVILFMLPVLVLVIIFVIISGNTSGFGLGGEGHVPHMGVGFALQVILGTIVWWWGIRFSLSLPAVAVDEDFGYGESWVYTGRRVMPVLTVAFFMILATVLVQYLVNTVAQASTTMAQIADVASKWGLTMLDISILTTLYGYLVQNRELI